MLRPGDTEAACRSGARRDHASQIRPSCLETRAAPISQHEDQVHLTLRRREAPSRKGWTASPSNLARDEALGITMQDLTVSAGSPW